MDVGFGVPMEATGLSMVEGGIGDFRQAIKTFCLLGDIQAYQQNMDNAREPRICRNCRHIIGPCI